MEFIPSIGPEALWGLAFVMWAWDAKLRVVPGSRIFQSALWSKRFTTVENPVGAFRKWVHFPNPLNPFSVEGVLLENEENSVANTGLSEKWLFERNLKDIDVLAFVSGIVFVFFFVLTPIMTMRVSLLLSCVVTLIISYLIMMYQFFWLWKRRRLYGLSRWDVVAMCSHCIFFPPYSANFARAVFARTGLSKSASRVSSLYIERQPEWMED